MGRPAPVYLSEDERDHVQVFVRHGKANASTLTRARVVLKSDEDWTDAEIAEALDLSEQTIRKSWLQFARDSSHFAPQHSSCARSRTILEASPAVSTQVLHSAPLQCASPRQWPVVLSAYSAVEHQHKRQKRCTLPKSLLRVRVFPVISRRVLALSFGLRVFVHALLSTLRWLPNKPTAIFAPGGSVQDLVPSHPRRRTDVPILHHPYRMSRVPAGNRTKR